MHPIKLGKHTIYASAAYQFTLAKAREDGIDLMVGLSSSWFGDTTKAVSCGIPEPSPEPLLPSIIVDWRDCSACDDEILHWLVDTVTAHLTQGEKINVSCMGGQGRTGTLLAILLGQAEHLSPKRAIKTLRARYCHKAVESLHQVIQVYEFLGSSEKAARREWVMPTPIYQKIWPFNKGNKDDNNLHQGMYDYPEYSGYPHYGWD